MARSPDRPSSSWRELEGSTAGFESPIKSTCAPKSPWVQPAVAPLQLRAVGTARGSRPGARQQRESHGTLRHFVGWNKFHAVRRVPVPLTPVLKTTAGGAPPVASAPQAEDLRGNRALALVLLGL